MHSLTKKNIVLLLFFSASCSASHATELKKDLQLIYGDEESITIATGTPTPVSLAPSVATVITAEDIRSLGATNLDQVLETVPGIHVYYSNLDFLTSSYSIRGIHNSTQNNQVLLLQNGIPLTFQPSQSRIANYYLPVENIARIEIVRGPGSAIYGADAFAGVINIITKDATDINGVTYGARAGSFDTQDYWLQYGTTKNDLGVAFNLEYAHSNGDDSRVVDSDFQTVLDNQFATNASLAPSPLSTRYQVLNTSLDINYKNWGFNFSLNDNDDAGIGAGAQRALDRRGASNTLQTIVDLEYRNKDVSKNWDLGFRITNRYQRAKENFNLLPPGAVVQLGADGNLFTPPFNTVTFPDGLLANIDIKNNTSDISFTAFYNGFDNHTLRFNTGYRYSRLEADEEKNFGPGVTDGTNPILDGTLTDVSDTPFVFIDTTTRKVSHFSLQDEWNFHPDWTLTAGLRYDHYSDFGSTVNPRLALVWAADYNLTYKLLYGEAFRAPSFSESFYINNPALLGNPSLDPETIRTLELNIDYRPSFDIRTQLSLYKYKIDDLIEFVTDPNTGTITAQNNTNQSGYGFELEAEWKQSPKHTLKANYAWQFSENDDLDHRVPDAPGSQFYVASYYNFTPDWLLTTQFNHVKNRKRAQGDTRNEVDDYSRLDMILRRKNLYDNYEIAAGVRNLLNSDGREPSPSTIRNDYPLQERSIFLEFRYTQ